MKMKADILEMIGIMIYVLCSVFIIYFMYQHRHLTQLEILFEYWYVCLIYFIAIMIGFTCSNYKALFKNGK